MPTPITGSAAGVTEATAITYNAPADGDTEAAASVNVAFQSIANELEYLRANTVKRTLAALVGGSQGQVGPTPYDVRGNTEAFDFKYTDGGVNGGGGFPVANGEAAPISTFIGSGSATVGAFVPGDQGEQDTRTYYLANGDIVIARGCFYNPSAGGTGIGKWQRSASHAGQAQVYQFGVGGFTSKWKAAGIAGDQWFDSAWDEVIVESAGDRLPQVIGVGSAPAYATHFSGPSGGVAAYTPLRFWKERGFVHVMGTFALDNVSNIGVNQIFNIPSGYRPNDWATLVCSLYGANSSFHGSCSAYGPAYSVSGQRNQFWLDSVRMDGSSFAAQVTQFVTVRGMYLAEA